MLDGAVVYYGRISELHPAWSSPYWLLVMEGEFQLLRSAVAKAENKRGLCMSYNKRLSAK